MLLMSLSAKKQDDKTMHISNDKQDPLVSVLVYNYNYGKYLRECLESIGNQTYKNIEIVFSDNASTDESWDTALEFQKSHEDLITITRNRRNFGIDANYMNCINNARGKYFVNFCSDDAMHPEYIERCVRLMESHANLGFVMVHRAIVDGSGNILKEPPFYNQTCVIPGHEQAAVYMLAAVNPSVSQIMYNRSKTEGKYARRALASRWYAQRMLDFNMCCEFDMGYIKDDLMFHRIHGGNDSLSAAANLMEVIGPYVLNLQFSDSVSNTDVKFEKVQGNLQPSLEKLSGLSLRYCIRALLENDENLAFKYFSLSQVFSENFRSDETHRALRKYWDADDNEKLSILNSLKAVKNLVTRERSYDPPPGSIPVSA